MTGRSQFANNKKGYVAKGYRYQKPDSMVKTVILLDPDTFSALRERALKHNTSFAEQARTMIKAGLEQYNNNSSSGVLPNAK
jgi:hypothetical protein